MLTILALALSATLCAADFRSNVIRPCKFNDHSCIRDNFALNSRCQPHVRGSVPPIVNLKEFRFEVPFFNASYVDRDLVISGMDRCYVSEFFFNQKTDGGVLGITCPWLNFVSKRVMYQHRLFQEDSVYNFNYNGTYPLIRLTTTLAKADKLDICNEFTYADVAVLPKFYVDPSDQATKKYLSTDLSMMNIYEREAFLYRGKGIMRYFVNNLICNFGCI